jgi:hypothetical protein
MKHYCNSSKITLQYITAILITDQPANALDTSSLQNTNFEASRLFNNEPSDLKPTNHKLSQASIPVPRQALFSTKTRTIKRRDNKVI